MVPRSADIVIVGGGIIGSAIAFFVARDADFDGQVVVVERDPTYARASSSLSVGGFRQQFSTVENIEIGRFGAQFFRTCREPEWLGPEAPDPSMVEAGYLFLATEGGREALEANVSLQTTLGVQVALLARDALAERFGWLHAADLAAAALGLRGEGWIDPPALMAGFREAAIRHGARFVTGDVASTLMAGGRLSAVCLAGGERIECGAVVNAAGPAAPAVSRMAGGVPLPVFPRKRMVFVFECRHGPEDAPLTIDPTGVYFRPEGGGRFLCGLSPPDAEDPDTEELDVDRTWFEERVWPALAARVPAFDSLRLRSAWAGLYAVNSHDHNAIVGFDPQMENFMLANGFSGHGVQQAPAIGRGAAELLVHGEFRSLDLGRLSPARLLTGERVVERNVI